MSWAHRDLISLENCRALEISRVKINGKMGAQSSSTPPPSLYFKMGKIVNSSALWLQCLTKRMDSLQVSINSWEDGVL